MDRRVETHRLGMLRLRQEGSRCRATALAQPAMAGVWILERA